MISRISLIRAEISLILPFVEFVPELFADGIEAAGATFGIKKITITVNNAKSTPIKDKSFILNDEMKIQKLDLSKTVKATEIHITINEVYPGKKWNDLVISDLFFCNNSNNYSVTYGCNPDLSVSGEARYNRKFDSNGNLLSETLQEGKSGSAEITYEYNEYNQLICKKEIWDDPNNPEVKNYSYKTNKDKYPADTTITYNSDGTIKTVAEKNWRGTKTYYFENNLCIAESVGKDFIIYQYKNMKKLFGIQVFWNLFFWILGSCTATPSRIRGIRRCLFRYIQYLITFLAGLQSHEEHAC